MAIEVRGVVSRRLSKVLGELGHVGRCHGLWGRVGPGPVDESEGFAWQWPSLPERAFMG